MVFNKLPESERDSEQQAMPSVPSHLVAEALEALRRYQKNPTERNLRAYEDIRTRILNIENSQDSAS